MTTGMTTDMTTPAPAAQGGLTEEPRFGTPLAQAAMSALTQAVEARATAGLVIEERAIFRPDTWLIQCCWQTLAAAGVADATLTVVRLSGERQPLASVGALYRLSQHIDEHWGLARALSAELGNRQASLLSPAPGQPQAAERLLYAAATAATIGERGLALAFLERLDQLPQPWDRIMVQPDQRSMLANVILRSGPHPLTISLLTTAPRRFGDAGAHLVAEVTAGAGDRLRRAPGAAPMARFLQLGVDTIRNATLTSLHSRRLTAAVLGQAGLVDEVLAQLTTIANVQAARREGGIALRQGDPSLLRQVKRPTANADVDFQVYTLREAIRALPLRQVSREARLELANRLAALGTQSDGWTAAGAAATLVDLGAVKYGVEVVSKIPATDPTRAEGVISLVRGLLVAGEAALAEEQAQSGLAWARSYRGRNPERALIWGLADVYLERNQTDHALALLDQWEQPSSFRQRMRGLFGRKLDDDGLRNQGLRLRCLLQRERTTMQELEGLVRQLLESAPELLDGEALVSFLLDDMLTPLLAAGRTRLAFSVLPALADALRSGTGEKHAARVRDVAEALVAELKPAPGTDGSNGAGGVASGEAEDSRGLDTRGLGSQGIEPDTRRSLEQFLTTVWQRDAERGIWQTVHGIEGGLLLVLMLEGPDAVEGIARFAAHAGPQWA